MSSRTAERARAVRKAWEREQQLVSFGEGTRDWTPDQQHSILDIGVALDDEGKPFEGQHMKSVAAFPEYAADPNNIQFLTRQEHLEAHDGSWQNQTNWYYNPITKEKTLFNDELIPCKVIRLSDPIIIPLCEGNFEKESELNNKADVDEMHSEASLVSDKAPTGKKSRSDTTKAHVIEQNSSPKTPKDGGAFLKVIKSIGGFVAEHPAETLEILGVVVTGIGKAVFSVIRSKSISSNTSSRESINTNQHQSAKTDIATEVADIIEKANRSSPREHEVPGHGQHYHTKDGVVWKEKEPYHRGHNKE